MVDICVHQQEIQNKALPIRQVVVYYSHLQDCERTMIVEDRVEMLPYDGVRSKVGEIGVVRGFREVGYRMENINYEYLVMFPDGQLFWIPARYLKEVKNESNAA